MLAPVLRPSSGMLGSPFGELCDSSSGLVGPADVAFGFMASAVGSSTCQLATSGSGLLTEVARLTPAIVLAVVAMPSLLAAASSLLTLSAAL